MENQGVLEAKPALAMEAPETRRPASEGATQNLNQLRQMVTNSMDELMRERETLSQKLSDANTYLRMIEAEREQLRTDLNKARKRARTGDKPQESLGLPKRVLLQIESEVERGSGTAITALALTTSTVPKPLTTPRTGGRERGRQLYANEILRISAATTWRTTTGMSSPCCCPAPSQDAACTEKVRAPRNRISASRGAVTPARVRRVLTFGRPAKSRGRC
jgi:hypothetical protein